jgi:UPF0176 protein
MDLDKVILYYGFTPIADTDAMKLWQKTLCESLNIKGRIIISPHGINGTLGGKMKDLKKYVKATSVLIQVLKKLTSNGQMEPH